MKRLAFGLFVFSVTNQVGGAAQAQTAGAAGSEAAKAAEPAPPPPATPDIRPEDAATPRAAGELATAKKAAWEDIVVVPRKSFLKGGRIELAPFSGVTLNDVLIRHYAFGAELNYYLTDVFSVGLQGLYFVKELSDRQSLVGLQYNRVPTLNKYKYAGALNFGYVPGYGKFTLFNKYIWHWDIFVQGGVGMIWTEIIPRIGGQETWQNMNLMPDFGIGTRFFLNRWMTLSFALRDYVFIDKFEPTDRMRDEPIDALKDRATSKFVNNFLFTASVGFYLPTSYEYKTPR